MVAMEDDRREHHVSIVLQGRDRLSRRRTLLDSDLIEERGGEIVVRYGLMVVVIAVVFILVSPLAFFDERAPALPREGAGARLVVQSSKFRLCHNCGQITELVSG